MNQASYTMAPALQPGDKLGNFEIQEQLASGGMGIIWKGYDRLLARAVAVKQIATRMDVDEAFREKFVKEAELHKKVSISHPNIVDIIDFVDEPRGLFLVMEFADGGSLDRVIAENPMPFGLLKTLTIVRDVAQALAVIHDAGIVHRDLKPGNIMMQQSGPSRVMDFGLATLMSDQDQMTMGTAQYMAPELFGGQPADARADIYALGMVAYQVLAGPEAYQRTFKAVLRDQRNAAMRWMKWHTNQRITAPPLMQLNEQVPEVLSDLIGRMMTKDVNQRIASAHQLLEAIGRHFSKGAQQAAAAAPAAAAIPQAPSAAPPQAPAPTAAVPQPPAGVPQAPPAVAVPATAVPQPPASPPSVPPPPAASTPAPAPGIGQTPAHVQQEPTVDQAVVGAPTEALPTKSKWPWVLLAASVVLAAGVGGYFVYKQSEEDKKIAMMIGALVTDYAAAEKQYKEHDFKGAAATLTELINSENPMLDLHKPKDLADFKTRCQAFVGLLDAKILMKEGKALLGSKEGNYLVPNFQGSLGKYDQAKDILKGSLGKLEGLPTSEEVNNLTVDVKTVESSRKEDAAFVRVCVSIEQFIVVAEAESDADKKNESLGNAQKLFNDFISGNPTMEEIEKKAFETLRNRTYAGIEDKTVIALAEKIKLLISQGKEITAEREAKSATQRFPKYKDVFWLAINKNKSTKRKSYLVGKINASMGAEKIKWIGEFIKEYPNDPLVADYAKARELEIDKIDAQKAIKLAQGGDSAGALAIIKRIKGKYPSGDSLHIAMADLEANLNKIASMKAKLDGFQDLVKKANASGAEPDFLNAIKAGEDYLALINDTNVSSTLNQLKIDLALVGADRHMQAFKASKAKRDFKTMLADLGKFIVELERVLAIDPNHERAVGGIAVAKAYIQFINKWNVGLSLYKEKDFLKAKTALRDAETFGKNSPVAQADKELVDEVHVKWLEANFEHVVTQAQAAMEQRQWKPAQAFLKVALGQISNLPEETRAGRKARVQKMLAEADK